MVGRDGMANAIALNSAVFNLARIAGPAVAGLVIATLGTPAAFLANAASYAAVLIGLKLILDLVPNHSSDAHPWFVASRSSRDNAKRDWYIWRDPGRDGGPPNNWISDFGGSAWEWDDATGQYYYHAFLKEQPDLNWRNQDVRTAMYEIIRFWLDRGVDGFRIDVLWHMVKAADLPNNPPNPASSAKSGDWLFVGSAWPGLHRSGPDRVWRAAHRAGPLL